MKSAKPAKVSVTPPQSVAQAIAAIAAASNTGTVVDWEKLHDNDGAAPALTRRQHFNLLVQLANGGHVSVAQWNALIGAQVMVDQRQQPVALELPAEYRAWLAAHLDRIVAGRGRQSALEVAAMASGGVVQVPAWRVTNRRLESRYRIVARDIRAALAYGLLLMLDPEQASARSLRRCKLSTCGGFYWYSGDESPTGETRNYCTREHQHLGTNERVLMRVQRYRKRNRQ